MWIEVFKAGTQTDSAGNQREWTEADLQSIAAKYNDQQAHEAPVTIGHPLDNSPAYGWVDALKAVGGTLYAKFRDLQSDFVQMVNEKRFPKRSIALYDDGLLRHIGFLGAAPPAVKGMPDPKLTFSAEKTFSAYDSAFSEALTEEPSEAKTPKSKGTTLPSKKASAEPKPTPQTQSFSRQARSAVWGIAPKERGHDDLPAHYQDLLPENFADPVNLRFPMDKRFMPAVLGTWKREDVRKEYSDKERNIISGRLAKAALHYGYNLTDNAFLEVPPELLSKNQLVKVVNGTAGAPAVPKPPQQQQSSSTQISPTKFEEGVMPLDQLQAMLEELLGFASETFGEETANQLAAKIQELQEKYKPQGGDAPAAAGTPPTAPAMSEQAKQFAEREKAMQARIDALEMTNRLTQFDQFCDRMIAQGSILTPQKDFVMELLAASSSVPGEMNFSEVKNNQRKQVKKNLTTALQEFIPMLKQISYGEQASGSGASAGNESASGEFSDAPPERLALHQKVVALQEERQKAGKSITYREALSLVSKEQRNG